MAKNIKTGDAEIVKQFVHRFLLINFYLLACILPRLRAGKVRKGEMAPFGEWATSSAPRWLISLCSCVSFISPMLGEVWSFAGPCSGCRLLINREGGAG